MNRRLRRFRATARLYSPQELRAWREVLVLDPCVYCGGTATGLDHITPSAEGGENGWPNRAPACARCDNQKSALPLLVYLVLRRRAAARVQARQHRYRVAGALENAWKSILEDVIRDYRKAGVE